MRKGPRQPGAAPSTMISWSVNSTPAEAEARDENKVKSRPIASMASVSRSISPSATPMPSEDAARDSPIDFRESRVAVAPPRASTSATRWSVSSGHLIWTK